MLSLSEPTEELETEYREMLTEWQSTGEDLIPFPLKLDCSNFSTFVRLLSDASQGIGLPSGFVPHTTYWLLNEQRIIGAVNLRHHLNEGLLQIGGHIGYGIRPSERGKGFAIEMLRLALEKAKEKNIDKALITCKKENIVSAKTILRNGGKLENEIFLDGKTIQRYWVELG